MVNRTESEQNPDRRIPVDLRQIEHKAKSSIYVEVVARNSVGQSPKASLKILQNRTGKRAIRQTRNLNEQC